MKEHLINVKKIKKTANFFDRFSPDSKEEYLKSRKYSKTYKPTPFNGYMQDMEDDFNNQWEKSKEIDNYTKKANSRPLHRKGSLNREL